MASKVIKKNILLDNQKHFKKLSVKYSMIIYVLGIAAARAVTLHGL